MCTELFGKQVLLELIQESRFQLILNDIGKNSELWSLTLLVAVLCILFVIFIHYNQQYTSYVLYNIYSYKLIVPSLFWIPIMWLTFDIVEHS